MAGRDVEGQLAGLSYGFATDADDAGLRKLLRETPVGGSVRLSFEREPHYFRSFAHEGIRHYTVCARDAGNVVAMASRTVWPTGVGYLHQLRVAPTHRHLMRPFMQLGFRYLRETRQTDEAPYDVTAIVADNQRARRLLEAGLPGMPTYTPFEKVITMLLPARAGFAAVDLRANKQVVVRGYGSKLRTWRWLLRLPPVGTVLPIAYVQDGAGPAPADCRWLVMGLPASDSRVAVLRRRYRPHVYESILYMVHDSAVHFMDKKIDWEISWL